MILNLFFKFSVNCGSNLPSPEQDVHLEELRRETRKWIVKKSLWTISHILPVGGKVPIVTKRSHKDIKGTQMVPREFQNGTLRLPKEYLKNICRVP